MTEEEIFAVLDARRDQPRWSMIEWIMFNGRTCREARKIYTEWLARIPAVATIGR